jgi:ATP-dependent DNA helicase RecQ
MDDVLKKYFGYSEFRPLQKDVINDILDNKDVFVLMPTGGGKSLCYQIPALMKEGVCVVVSPLISLMKDQVDGLKQNGINAEFLNSTLSESEQSNIINSIKLNELDLIYVAPERITQPNFLELLSSIKISMFAIDESHCVSEWGHDFRPDYIKLSLLRETFTEVPIMALTATATERVQKDIISSLNLKNTQTYKASFDRTNLHYAVLPQHDSYNQLLSYLHYNKGKSGIIYCLSRKGVENLTEDLTDEGYKVLPYHAGLSGDKRAENQERFIKDDVDIIVATVAFGMGIDKPDVRFVVHYNLPSSLERYYQETGRAGRDGLPSECILFFGYGDKSKITFFIEQKEDEKEKNIGYAQLRSMIDFCESNLCRRDVLLGYFGEIYYETNCKNCDNCINPKDLFDGTEIAQKILSCVFRVDQRFGVVYISKVLTGSKEKQILVNNHEKLSTYSIIKNYSAKQVEDFIRELVQKDLLKLNEDRFSVLQLTKDSNDVLKGNIKVMLTKPSKPQAVISGNIKTNYDDVLFENLKRLRKVLADQLEIPPYQVFNDKTLQEMCIFYPQSNESFINISGVGSKKLESFGEQFLEVIKQYCLQNEIDEIPKLQSIPINSKKKLRSSSSSTKSYDLYKSGMKITEIAKERRISERTVVTHIEDAILAGNEVNIRDFTSKNKEELIKLAIEDVGSDLLTPIKESVGKSITYDEIRIVRASILYKNRT